MHTRDEGACCLDSGALWFHNKTAVDEHLDQVLHVYLNSRFLLSHDSS